MMRIPEYLNLLACRKREFFKAKRKEEEAPVKAEKPKAAQERPRERKLKFSFKEQREFETIDEDLAALEQQIKDCEEAQSACGSDYVKLQ